MGKKTADFTPEAIGKLAQDKPVVYKLFDRRGENIYTGSAKRGEVADRIKDHLPGGPAAIQGAVKVEIQQHPSIDKAVQSEAAITRRSKPKYNKRGQ